MNQNTSDVRVSFLTLIYFLVITVVLPMIAGCSGGGGSAGNNSTVVDTGGASTGGGSGTGGGGVSPALGVVSMDPDNGDTNVGRDAMVNVTFTDGMDVATINDFSFTLADSSGASIPGAVGFDAMNNVATFTPSRELGIFRTYTAALSSDITHSGGTPIDAMNWSFVTRDGVWNPAEQIEVDIATGTEPKIDFDSDGNAIAVWINDGSEVYTNKFTASTNTWGNAERIDSLPSTVSDLQLAMGANGTAIAVWAKAQGQAKNIRAARYNGVSWQAHVGLETNGGIAQSPQAAVDSSGNAVVVWLQPDNSVNSIWYNYYDASGPGWIGENLLELTDNVAYAPHVSIDNAGDAIAVWAQDNGSGTNGIYASKYTFGGSWSSAELVGAGSSDGYTAQIAMDNQGNAIAVWYQVTATSPYYVYSVYANTYSSGAWNTPAEIESGVNIAATPQIGFDVQRGALVVWKNSNGRLRIAPYTYPAGWGAAENVESGADATFNPQLAVDSEGNAIVVWRQYSSGTYVYSLWVSRYQTGGTWGTPQLLELDDTTPVTFPDVAIDGDGNAFAIWIQNDGISDSTWVSRFE